MSGERGGWHCLNRWSSCVPSSLPPSLTPRGVNSSVTSIQKSSTVSQRVQRQSSLAASIIPFSKWILLKESRVVCNLLVVFFFFRHFNLGDGGWWGRNIWKEREALSLGDLNCDDYVVSLCHLQSPWLISRWQFRFLIFFPSPSPRFSTSCTLSGRGRGGNGTEVGGGELSRDFDDYKLKQTKGKSGTVRAVTHQGKTPRRLML